MSRLMGLAGAVLLLSLSACAVYPPQAAIVVRPTPLVAGPYWSPGHVNRWGYWVPGHWS